MARAADLKAKNQAMAAYMQARGITRTTTACAHHCGAHPQLGEAFIRHLLVCRGTRRQAGVRQMARAA